MRNINNLTPEQQARVDLAARQAPTYVQPPLDYAQGSPSKTPRTFHMKPQSIQLASGLILAIILAGLLVGLVSIVVGWAN